MERGEVDGRGSSSWASWLANKPDWVRDKKILFLFQVGTRRLPDLPNVPLWSDLATNDEDRQVLAALSSSITIGYSVIAPQDIPGPRVMALGQAFNATMRDPAFLADAKKQKLIINPIDGEDVAEIAAKTASLSPNLVVKILSAMKASDVTKKSKSTSNR